jgi:hypothetical protein
MIQNEQIEVKHILRDLITQQKFTAKIRDNQRQLTSNLKDTMSLLSVVNVSSDQ